MSNTIGEKTQNISGVHAEDFVLWKCTIVRAVCMLMGCGASKGLDEDLKAQLPWLRCLHAVHSYTLFP